MTDPTTRKIHLATGLDYNVYAWDAAPSANPDLTYVLVHGFTDFGFGWCELAPRLAARGQVIAPDLRGHGDSEWIGRGGYYHFLDYVADLDDVLRQLARPRVVLVGHSMGGSVSGYYAGIRPERLAALVLLEGLGPPDMSGADGPHRTTAWIDAWRAARDSSSGARTIKPMPTLDDAVRRLRKNDELLGEDLARRMAVAGTREVFGGLVWKHDPLHTTFGPYPFRLDVARRYWERVTCPTLIVDGAQSRMNLSEAERAARRACFAGARHLVLDQAGHALHRHQPAALAEAILTLG